MRIAVAFALVALPATFAQAQATSVASATDLVSQLGSALKISPQQAEGAAGAMFGLAKSRLKPEDFSKVAASLPGMDGLLKAAPAVDPASSVIGKTGLGGLTAPFSKLGLSPDVAMKAAPMLADYVGKAGGKDVGKLLAGAFN